MRALGVGALALLAAGLSTTGRSHAEDPLFESLEPLSIRLSGPLRALARDRDEDPEYRPATLSYRDAAGAWRPFEIKVRPRGRSRRDNEVCSFPPLRINFRKEDVVDSVFDGQDKLKLVTHCRRSDRHDRYVYKEYLVYRLLNQLTDASFRVKPLDVEYVDEDHKGRTERRFGFFIEDKDRLADRLGLTVFDGGIRPAQLDPEHATLMELFQFMIGNTDFSFIAPPLDDDCCHNAVLMTHDEGDGEPTYLPMPYDFDITGLVDPPYAVVDYRLPIRDVRQRLFRGFCRGPERLAAALERFRAARPRMLSVLETETPLDERNREQVLDYVQEFFQIIDDPQARERELVRKCRGNQD